MTFHVHHYHHFGDDKVLKLLEGLMATQAELTAQVAAVNAKLTKIGDETRSLLAKVEELTAVIANGPPVTPELQAAVDALTAQAELVDALVPDVAPPPA